MPLERGSRIGRYEILSEIGTGGMSEVFDRLRATRWEGLVMSWVRSDLGTAWSEAQPRYS